MTYKYGLDALFVPALISPAPGDEVIVGSRLASGAESRVLSRGGSLGRQAMGRHITMEEMLAPHRSKAAKILANRKNPLTNHFKGMASPAELPPVPILARADGGVMLGKAIKFIKEYPGTGRQKMEAFTILAGQIAKKAHNGWSFAPTKGVNGAMGFIGGRGRTLYITKDGRLYVGEFNILNPKVNAFKYQMDGQEVTLEPMWEKLKEIK